ncbi:MAG: hypothetical protein IK083_10770 [Abditibacteriota bacterium]|nr:hypothetical protein [Abditibacteriota bacterium]
MLAGFGKEIINPPVGAELSGYGYYRERRNTGVMDNLYARCLYVEKDGLAAAAVSCDLLGLTGEVCSRVRDFASSIGIPPERLMLCATHTHTGPAVAHLEGLGVVDPRYVAELPDMIISAIKKAVADKAEVTDMQSSDTPIEPVGFNRALPGGPHDNRVRGVLIGRASRPIALLSYACHPVTLGPRDKFSPDYPGEVCKVCEEQGMEAVFFTGICGDVDPVNNLIEWGSGTKETIREYGERIFAGFEKGLAPCPADFAAAYFPTELPVVPMTPEEAEACLDKAGHEQVAAFWMDHIRSIQPTPDSERIEVRAFRLGDLIIASIPYEGFTVIGDLLREAWPKAFVAGCADAILGYLPAREDWDCGCYAAIGSVFFYGRQIFQKGAAEQLGALLRDRLPGELA